MEIPLPQDDVPGDNSASGTKRSFGDIENDEDAISESKKVRMQLGDASKLILALQQSLQKFTDDLASTQNELETAKTENEKWKKAFKKESFVPSGKAPEPEFVVDYIQSLRASETSLNEQLEIAQMKLAIRDLKDEVILKRESTEVAPNDVLRAEIAQLRESVARTVTRQGAMRTVMELIAGDNPTYLAAIQNIPWAFPETQPSQ